MTTQTLHLIDEYLMQGGYTPGIDAETLEREAALVAAAPQMRTALDSMVLNFAQTGRVTDEFVRDVARMLLEIDA
jgi:hypothetical protein